MFAPRRAASRINFSARATLASRSQLHAICVAATVTLLMAVCYLDIQRLKRRRGARAHDLALLATGITEAMWDRTFEIVGVARRKDARLAAHRQLDAALDDHPALLARVRQHLFAGVRIRRVAL